MNWDELGLSKETLSLVEQAGFASPTPVQESAIPAALEGRDLLVSAKTGSGKTVGFCFPMIEKLRGKGGTQGLILCPTREIALQTQAVLEQFAKPQGVTSMSVIGGVKLKEEEAKLREYPQIIVGTPGRICDHQERGNIWFEYIEKVVLDEADQMLNMGFALQLNKIMDAIPTTRQTLLFSATVTGEAERISKRYLKDPKRISMGSALRVAETVEQELLWVNRSSKMRELLRILREEKGSIIIFTRTKLETLNLWRSIHSRGYDQSGYLSSDKLQKYREQTLTDFRDGKIRILIATDVAGRGIHVEDVAHVISYDFPLQPEDYIHRVGRTGRQEKSGKATSFVTPQDSVLLVQVEKVLGKSIPEKKAEDYHFEKARPQRGRYAGRSRPRRR